MQLSVIIVNYNVSYFLQQCLHSVYAAGQGIEMEVIVVDNNSVDDSLSMLRTHFPEVQIIGNQINVGFSKANNQAMRVAKGEYILLLNPDTIVEEDTFEKSLKFMSEHPDAGALGVKMIDGKGRYAPESKRALPSITNALYKIIGLASLFPRSKRYAAYYNGHLDEHHNHPIEIVSGAFMMMRRKVLEDTVGYLDEAFFMYGEDTDLSYRFLKAGYQNYYLGETSIIHYKGESTKKGSLNYVYTFYNSMVIFFNKHLANRSVKLFLFFIHLAILLKASSTILRNFVRRTFYPLMDFVTIYVLWMCIAQLWIEKIWGETKYPPEYFRFVVPSYILIWLLSVFFCGGYDKPVQLRKILKGSLVGVIIILVLYALLPNDLRYSRGLIVLGSFLVFGDMLVLRLLYHFMGIKSMRLGEETNKRCVIVGDVDEAERVADLLCATDMRPSFIGWVNETSEMEKHPSVIGSLHQLGDILRLYKIQEVVFCAKSLSQQTIIQQMSLLASENVEYKIVPPESSYLVGSNVSIGSVSNLYILPIRLINTPMNRRNKRTFDLIASVMIFLLSPILLCVVKSPSGLWKNLFQVIVGQRTWVGYCEQGISYMEDYPKISKGVLHTLDAFPNQKIMEQNIQRMNLLYARNYHVMSDVKILLRNIKSIGRR